jgi:hypothetical protein
VEVHEEYTRQHTPDDLPEFMDWTYLANVTKANLAVMEALSQADLAPTNVRVKLDQSHDTTLTWKGIEGVKHSLFWRETTSPVWTGYREVGAVATATIPGVNKDDHVFGVGAIGGVPVVAR